MTPEKLEKLQMSKLLENEVVLKEILEALSDQTREEIPFVSV